MARASGVCHVLHIIDIVFCSRFCEIEFGKI